MRKLIHWLKTGLVFLLLNGLAATALHAQAPTTLEGVLNIVWGDPHPTLGGGGTIRYRLTQANGVTVDLDMGGQDSVAASYFGKSVIVAGRTTSNVPNVSNATSTNGLSVETIRPSNTGKSNAVSASVLGTKKVIYLLVKFSDDSAVPHPPSFFTNLNNPDTPPGGELFPATVNGFFHKTSWGQFSWVGDVGGLGGLGAPGGWLTLPQSKSYYANCGWSSSCANLQQLSIDATALGRAQGIVFTNYDNINFVLSNDLDCCAWGGGFYSSVDAKSYGATWEPPWGQEAGTYAHEMGHSLGLPHSGWVYSAYDSPWDMMSDRRNAQNTACGSYASKTRAARGPCIAQNPVTVISLRTKTTWAGYPLAIMLKRRCHPR